MRKLFVAGNTGWNAVAAWLGGGGTHSHTHTHTYTHALLALLLLLLPTNQPFGSVSSLILFCCSCSLHVLCLLCVCVSVGARKDWINRRVISRQSPTTKIRNDFDLLSAGFGVLVAA